MADSFGSRIRQAWNAFVSHEEREEVTSYGYNYSSYGGRPDRSRLSITNDRSIVTALYTRLGIDVAAIDMLHVRLDENKNFVEEIPSGLNNCLTVEANIDQGGRQFRQDIAMSLFDKGVVAIVPVDTSSSPDHTGSYDIWTLRVGEIVTWYPRHVRVRVYNDRTGEKQEIIRPKNTVAIIENPLYSVMNEPNSTLQRLIRKLSYLDAVDEATSSGKLDLIIQLPYVIKSKSRQEQAEQKRRDIEVQLKDSKYGIGYIDSTEKITQLNRPAENNMLKQVEFLTAMLYSQLGVTPAIFDGTADEATMLNYHNRTVEPILGAITEAMNRVFLTKTARTQRQLIKHFRDPFKSVAISSIAEIADKFTRNEILSSNEIRSIMGFKPVNDPRADELRNKNLPKAIEPEVVSEDKPVADEEPI